MGDNVVIGIQEWSSPSGSTDSMGARFSLSTYLHWFLWSEYEVHFVSLQTHLFVVGFWWANIYKTSARWVKGQRWKVGIVAETKDKYNLVIWFWIDVAAWNELPNKFICTCVYSARAPKFPLFSNHIDLVRQGDVRLPLLAIVSQSRKIHLPGSDSLQYNQCVSRHSWVRTLVTHCLWSRGILAERLQKILNWSIKTRSSLTGFIVNVPKSKLKGQGDILSYSHIRTREHSRCEQSSRVWRYRGFS